MTSTQTQQVTIQNSVYTIGAPYSAGHVVTENEAAALNQLWAENLRNNFAARIKAAVAKGEPTPGQAELTEYESTYAFSGAGGGLRTRNPDAEFCDLMRERMFKRLNVKRVKLDEETKTLDRAGIIDYLRVVVKSKLGADAKKADVARVVDGHVAAIDAFMAD